MATRKAEFWGISDAQMSRRIALGLDHPGLSSFVSNHEFVSLGCSCEVADALKSLGLRKLSYPFDWTRSSVDGVLHCIQNDFVDFITFTDVEQRSQGAAFLGSRWGGSFWFHDLRQPDTRGALVRRIKRFLGDGEVKPDKPRVFVWAVNSSRELESTLRLRATLEQLFPEAEVLLLVLVSFQSAPGPLYVRAFGWGVIFYRLPDAPFAEKDQNLTMGYSKLAHEEAIAFAINAWRTERALVNVVEVRSLGELVAACDQFDGGNPAYDLFRPRRIIGFPVLVNMARPNADANEDDMLAKSLLADTLKRSNRMADVYPPGTQVEYFSSREGRYLPGVVQAFRGGKYQLDVCDDTEPMNVRLPVEEVYQADTKVEYYSTIRGGWIPGVIQDFNDGCYRLDTADEVEPETIRLPDSHDETRKPETPGFIVSGPLPQPQSTKPEPGAKITMRPHHAVQSLSPPSRAPQEAGPSSLQWKEALDYWRQPAQQADPPTIGNLGTQLPAASRGTRQLASPEQLALENRWLSFIEDVGLRHAWPANSAPGLLLCFKGVPQPPPPHFDVALHGALARLGAQRVDGWKAQILHGVLVFPGVIVSLTGDHASIKLLQRLPLSTLVVMCYPISDVVWNPMLIHRRAPVHEEVRYRSAAQVGSRVPGGLMGAGSMTATVKAEEEVERQKQEAEIISKEVARLRKALHKAGASEDFIGQKVSVLESKLKAAMQRGELVTSARGGSPSPNRRDASDSDSDSDSDSSVSTPDRFRL